jgi:LysM repeat protein
MPERKPNYFARVLAMLALIGAFVLVIFILATTDSSDSGDDGDGDKTATEKGPTKKGESALDEGVWILRDGDTLTSISQQTGIDVDELEDLNPDIDPQTLAPGQRIVLIEGGGDSSSNADSTPGPDGTGVGDEGPTGSSSSSDDSSLSD